MPAKSKKQQQMFAIALHNPKKLYKKNRGVLGMSKKSMREYAKTPAKTLPERVGYCKGGLVKAK